MEYEPILGASPRGETAAHPAPLPARPFVSILIPSYNEASYIEETIRSVLLQDYPFIELIVADGASTDGTQNILRRYENDHRFQWLSEPDNGPLSALDKCLRMARGQLTGIQLANDTYTPGAIREMVEQFQIYPNLALVGGWIQHIDEHSVAISRERTFRDDVLQYSVDDIVAFRGPLPPVQTSLLRRDLVLSIGGNMYGVRTGDRQFLAALHDRGRSDRW